MYRSRYLIGLLTLGLSVFGVWFLWNLLDSNEDHGGLHLRIEFRDARGLRPGADVRYRGVHVGGVRSVQITEDGGKAFVDLVLIDEGAAQACVNSTFWIVAPRFAGLTGGASGLDTLVRDTYVAFFTPEKHGSLLLAGSLIGGAERPPQSLEPESLEPLRHGDLLMTVLVPENHGLKPGAPVIFRGMTTGDVRSVALAEDGSHVEVQLRIGHRFRSTVVDTSTFWVARPYVSGALFSGFTVSDVGALVAPFVNYYTKPGDGVPVEDGFRVLAVAARPEHEVATVPESALRPRKTETPDRDDPLVLVRIVYTAIEEDTFSANDDVRHEGTGVLYLDKTGRAAVFTTRSIADGSFTEQDSFGGDPDIGQENIKVLIPEGPVLRAHRVWVAPDGRDLAVLVLEDAPPSLQVTRPDLLVFDLDEATKAAEKLVAAASKGGGREPVVKLGPDETPDFTVHMGGAVMLGQRIVGVFGQPAAHTEGAVSVPLDVVPEDLRPQ